MFYDETLMNLDNIVVDEEEVLSEHVNKIARVPIEYNHLRRIAEKYRNPRNEVEKYDLLVALNRLPILQHDLETLRKMNNDEIVVQAKVKKYAFLEAKKRYEALSSVEKLKAKVNGRKLNWQSIKNDPSVTVDYLNQMYNGKSR